MATKSISNSRRDQWTAVAYLILRCVRFYSYVYLRFFLLLKKIGWSDTQINIDETTFSINNVNEYLQSPHVLLTQYANIRIVEEPTTVS